MFFIIIQLRVYREEIIIQNRNGSAHSAHSKQICSIDQHYVLANQFVNKHILLVLAC